ncbi:homeodomain-like protein [Tanacetum coccineum]
MTGNQKLFSTYKAYNGGNIIFGSNLRGNIIGKGTISHGSRKIANVEHLDNLGFNLLSVGQICNSKCKVIFSENDSKIVKDGKVIASKELVRNLPKLKFDQHFCDACKIRKQAHSSHKAKNVVSTTTSLEHLHMDLSGPSIVQSYEGNLYNLVIIDDYSRFLALSWHLEEIHVTWAHLEKKQTRLRLYTNDGVEDFVTASELSRLKVDLEPSMWRRCHGFKATSSPLVDSRLESIEQFLNNFANQPNETDMNDLESDDESLDTPLVSPFPHSDNDSDDGEVLNELSEYENAGVLRRERIINIFDGDDLAFQYMIGFRKFTAYLNPFLPMNIISRKSYNTIMVEGLEGTGKNLVSIVRDVYVFVGSFTYITDFVVLKDIREFIVSDMAKVLMGKPFRKITKLKYDFAKGLVSFTKIFHTYIFRMPRTIPRLRNVNWSKIPPLLELSQRDLMRGLRHLYEKNKLMYKNCLNLGPEYQVYESMKE